MNEIATLGAKVVNYTLGMAQFVERIRNAFSFGKHVVKGIIAWHTSFQTVSDYHGVVFHFSFRFCKLYFHPGWIHIEIFTATSIREFNFKRAYFYDIIIPYFANDFQTSRDIFTSHSHHLTTFSIIYLIPYLTHLEWLVVTRWAHDQTPWLVQHKQNNSFMDKGCKS